MNDVQIAEDDEQTGKSLVAFECDEPLRQMVRKEAYERDISVSAMIRYALRKYFNKHEEAEKR